MACDVAISYASEDGAKAADLHQQLRARGLTVFLDQDPEQALRGWGKRVKTHLAENYRNAGCCVVLYSNAYRLSEWGQFELERARNALPVLVDGVRLPKERRNREVVYRPWPDGGAAELVDDVIAKIDILAEEAAERKASRKRLLAKGALAVGTTAAGIVATAAANRRTQARVEENTGSIGGHWSDPAGSAWEIHEDGNEITMTGRAPNGVDVTARGSRHGRSLRAEWTNGTFRGVIAADVVAGGRRIEGRYSSSVGGAPFVLVR